MSTEQCHIALKEWAVTVRALAQGQQVLLLRKGGIHESSKDFRVIHREFLLYPTFKHQRKDLLKEGCQPALRDLLDQPRDESRICFSHWAKVEETIEVSQQARVEALSPYHIWTNDYAQSRLRWKPMLPLAVLLLRVYRLEQPLSLPSLPEYRGCTSWVEVLERVPLGRMEPVLDDEEFHRRIEEIQGALGAAVPA
jgi:hypothetical protein